MNSFCPQVIKEMSKVYLQMSCVLFEILCFGVYNSSVNILLVCAIILFNCFQVYPIGS